MPKKFKKFRINSVVLKSDEVDDDIAFYYHDMEPEQGVLDSENS